MSLLKVENLSIQSYSGGKLVKDISFEINIGETLVMIGESGSGKTLTSLAILDMLPSSVIKTKGNILINNANFSTSMCGSQISMIMQAPATCFDQVYTIRTFFTDTLKAYKKKQKQIQKYAGLLINTNESNIHSTRIQKRKVEISDEYFIKIIEEVELQNPLEILNSFAFQLSGGTLQRLMIALNFALDPQIIIADEATSDIDIVAQTEILKLFSRMNKKRKGLLFITHDMSVAKQMADRVIVMKHGKIIDNFLIQNLHCENRHEYTKKLLLAHKNLNTNPWGINFSK